MLARQAEQDESGNGLQHGDPWNLVVAWHHRIGAFSVTGNVGTLLIQYE